ncbi:MAG: hypothetical protein QNJ88_02860 [Acidimicrobiia bacterium]|nr:hypothetical protein [Acidimicrobiia bacterium]
MEHTSGFRPPGRDVPHSRDMKRSKHDHASRNYQKHLADRFRERELERKREEEAASRIEKDDTPT